MKKKKDNQTREEFEWLAVYDSFETASRVANFLTEPNECHLQRTLVGVCDQRSTTRIRLKAELEWPYSLTVTYSDENSRYRNDVLRFKTNVWLRKFCWTLFFLFIFHNAEWYNRVSFIFYNIYLQYFLAYSSWNIQLH